MLTPLLEDDPRQVGPYRLQNRIGAGGMGTVYLGFTPDQRAVAVKVASEDLAEDAEFRSRFEREVHAALRVRGSAVAAVLDADTEAAAPWMVTEYVEGISLAQAVRARGRLENHLVRGLAVGLADALVAIHSAGVVHRDLKPSNILLAWDGPKVIDFGVAHLTDSSTLTRTGHVIGTLAWMSPEQMRGESSGPSSDVFAWANCVTYAATGRHPFHADSPDKLALRVQRDRPDLDALPAYLHTVVDRSLSKDPARRPTASALLAALVGRTSVEGVTEADAVAGDFLERTWTGTGQVPGESVTVLPGAGAATGARPGGPAPGAVGAVGAVGQDSGGQDSGGHGAGRERSGAARGGRGVTPDRQVSGWSPPAAGAAPLPGPWPVGAPPPASAFRPSVPPPIPPPLPSFRLTPLPPVAPAPPRPLPPSRSGAVGPGSLGPAGAGSVAGGGGGPAAPSRSPHTPRSPQRPSSSSRSPSPPSPPVVSPWTYDEDDPDPRAPVRARPAPQRSPIAGEDAWLEERERRPRGRPAAARSEETIRPPDPTPRSRPPRPTEFGESGASGRFATPAGPSETASSGSTPAVGQPSDLTPSPPPSLPLDGPAPHPSDEPGQPSSIQPAQPRSSQLPPRLPVRAPARAPVPARIPPPGEIRAVPSRPSSAWLPTPVPLPLPAPPVRASLPAPPVHPSQGQTPHPVPTAGASPLVDLRSGEVRAGGPSPHHDRPDAGTAGGAQRRFPPTKPAERGLNGRALLSVVLALGWLFGLGSVAAVVLGRVARAQIRQHNQRGQRLATVGIGLGWTGIGLTATSLLVVLALR
ncbi:eukaryotic-like serine/threonine-protein kinase [Frankia sp. AiPs1]|uniref:protein kinase domain-containing protein n=1 Tax=Frankia sp. AiPa1 TaxID=573492 RepID=UPI00202B46CA|nr:protein kinase [Frankia sp. AiPa1]MCL9757750.1 protein kinase [Frankia sp. AiPa1]